MGLRAKYRFCCEGRWRLWVLSEVWSQGLWAEILRHLRSGPWANHPQTKRFCYPQGEGRKKFYLKIYHGSRALGTFKDLFRDSKALRALKQGEALSKQGFHVPRAVAAGEERSFRFLKRAFLLTSGIEGLPLPFFLQERCRLPLDPGAVRKKRGYLKQLALEIRCLHDDGFVHGDLVPYNILVNVEEERVTFFYMDNDRTRRYPAWFPHPFWKRNLVQLNRFVLPGISLQDRMRFLKFYLGNKPWRKGERRLVRWLEEKTRKRRQKYDGVEASISFR